MPDPKLAAELKERIERSAPGELIDVVIELKQDAAAPETRTRSRSRAAEIARRKDAFERVAAPVTEAVEAAGGQVRAGAWINRTLRVRIAPERVSALGELESIDQIDVTHEIEPDEGASPR